MSPLILDGKRLSSEIREIQKNRVSHLKQRGISPRLDIIFVGDNPASEIYTRMKQKACRWCGIKSVVHRFDADISEEEVLEKIAELNRDKSVNGILIQLPLPAKLSESDIINAVDPKKDVDGLTATSLGHLVRGEPSFIPCTPAGVITLLKNAKISLEGKSVVIINRSNLVGKPLIFLFLRENSTVTVCHSKTIKLEKISSKADILVTAIGRPRFITQEYIKQDSVVIDVGINYLDGKIVGDVDFDGVVDKASAITPVPGGTGPMTITMLLDNTIKAAEIQNKIRVNNGVESGE